MSRKEKSARVLDTPEADYEEQSDFSLQPAEKIINDEPKDYATMRAQFALRGRALTRAHRVPDGHITFVVTSWAGARYFSHLHDVQGYLSQITESVRLYARGRGDGL